MKNKNWWEEFFEESFADFFLERDEKNLEDSKNFLIDALSLKKDMTLFDQCSGLGNVSHALSRSGVRTIGVEQSREYVRIAKEVADKEKLPCEFVRGDALTFLPSVKCDAAINWYTSFGYSMDDETNLEMLRRDYESLKDGGYFALDFHNLARVFGQPASTKLVRKNKKDEECVITRVSTFNLEEGSYLSEWTYEYSDGTVKKRQGTTRIYLPHQ